MSFGEYIQNANTQLLLGFNGNRADKTGKNIATEYNPQYGINNGKFSQGVKTRNASSLTSGFSVANQTWLSPNFGNFTLSIWFLTSDTRTLSAKYLMIKYNNAAQNNVYFINLTTVYGIQGYYRDNSGNAVTVSYGSGLNDGKWHHVAWVRNGTTGLMYLDGKFVGSNTNSLMVQIINTNNAAAHLWIGIYSNSTSPTAFQYQYHFDGLLDEAMMQKLRICWPVISGIVSGPP